MLAGPDPRPHVLTLTDVIGYGGAESVAEELAAGPDSARFRRTLCASRPVDGVVGSDQSVGRLREAGVDVMLLQRRGTLDVRSLRPLLSLLRNGSVDVIHAHKFGSNVWAAVLGRMFGIPVVIAHEHTWSFEGQPLRRLIDRHVVARACDAVIAVSEADRARMIGTVGMAPDRVVVVPNGIPEPPAGDPGAARRELGIAPDVPLLVMTAVLRPQKAVDVVLEAMAVLRRTHPRARLLLAGEGAPEYERALRERAGRLRLGDTVTFLGVRRDVPDLLAGGMAGVLSSDFEGMPLAVLEYMAAALPVVATAVGGVPELVVEGETGLLVPPRDPAALAAALARLLDDPALAREMGARGRERQRERFSEHAMVGRVTELYERLLAAPRARSARAGRATLRRNRDQLSGR